MFFTYCEFYLALFVYSIPYVISAYIIQSGQEDLTQLVKSQIQVELRYFIDSTTNWEISRSLIFAICCLCGKYLQQADVCMLIIRKQAVARQQSQLQNYFMKQKDGVLIYSKLDSTTEYATDTSRCSFTQRLKLRVVNDQFKNIMGYESIVDLD